MQEDMTAPQAPTTHQASPVTELEPVRSAGRSRVPFGLAALAAGLGIAAVAVGVTAAGPSGAGTPAAPQGVALISDATPAPVQNGQGGQGNGGWTGPGRGFGGGMMGGARFGGPRGGASVTSISGTQLALRTDDGWTRTIDASGATITKAGAAATLAGIAVGDEIAFAQQRNADGTYTITKIAIVAPHVAGTVTATSASGLTLKAQDGSTVTVTVSSSTTYRVAGNQSGTLADIKVGDVVVASGTKSGDGSIAATEVNAFTPGTGGPMMGGPHGGWDGDGNGRHGPNASPTPTPPGA